MVARGCQVRVRIKSSEEEEEVSGVCETLSCGVFSRLSRVCI